MHNLLDDYDWEEAFRYANPPQAVPPGAQVDTSDFIRDDVESLHWYAQGENDGPSWITGGQLKDGRWFFLEAGCDYTGWDCQASGQGYVASERDAIARYAMSDRDRERLRVWL